MDRDVSLAARGLQPLVVVGRLGARADILSALEAERAAATRGAAFKALSARRVGGLIVLELEPRRDGRGSTALDESLEGARAVWFGNDAGRGEVVVVDPEKGEVALRFVQGELPPPDETIRLFPHDFLSPLIDLWRDPGAQQRAMRVLARTGEKPIKAPSSLPSGFAVLRDMQTEAVQVGLYSAGLIIGPPGTGKTFTVGALVANLLRRFPEARLLVTGPTNVAVDTALRAADDWLLRIGRDDIRPTMKRIGSRFDPKSYGDCEHLLAPGLYEASVEIAMLELEEPTKADIERYVAWKEKLEAARAKLSTDVTVLAKASRVVALTTSSLFHHYAAIREAGPWHFVVADEASQIMLPAALMAAGAGGYVTFSGDPHQLAPIVKSDAPEVQATLGTTAFEALPSTKQVFLNEQSRMTHAVCDVVSSVFYEGRLRVCGKALRDPDWKKVRAPWFLNGREVPRVMVDERGGAATWSQKYNGLIRFESAKIVEALVNELLGSYVSADEMLVLTPFRAQRALLKAMLKRDGTRGVRISTVHRSQGSESKIVIFDPVDGGGSFLNSETGRRLINVAASRAQAHLILTVGPKDMTNPYLRAIQRRASKLWDRPGAYATPLRVRLQHS